MHRLRTRNQCNKTTDMPPGVSMFWEKSRWPNGKKCLTFSVNFTYLDGRVGIKRFRCGTLPSTEMFHVAKRAACRFRMCFEQCRDSGVEFKPEWFDNWRKTA